MHLQAESNEVMKGIKHISSGMNIKTCILRELVCIFSQNLLVETPLH
jgi:hypothetical protein